MLSPAENRRSIAALRIEAIGFARDLPAISGAEPWIGSYKAGLPPLRRRPFFGGKDEIEAEGNIPKEPPITADSSERISPNKFSATITSNIEGWVIICIAALSANIWINSTSGYSIPTSVATSRQSRDDSITFILSSE